MRSTYHRLGRRLSIVAATLAALLLLGAASAGPVASAADGTELLVMGAGEGHGVGMSQEGALGYAEHGATYQQILAHYYTGTALGQAPAGAIVRVLVGDKVRRVALETYVSGVVSAEVPASWPLAALEAQAVASRTYALTAHAGGSKFDVYADARSQVYRGVAAETPQTDAAVTATAGQIVTYEGRPAITYFFASSGGMTEDVENGFPGAEPEPWLRAVADPYDAGPLHSWTLSISFATASARLKGLVRGGFRGIEVTKRGVSPRIVSAEVLGTGGATPVSGPELADRLGLYDTWAYFSVRRGHSVRTEPDRSGQPIETSPRSSPAPALSPAPSAAPSRVGGVSPDGPSQGPASSSAGSAGAASTPSSGAGGGTAAPA